MKETNKGWKVKMADVYWGWTPTLVRIYAWSVASDSFDPIDSSQRGSFIHGILQAIILEWVATSFSRGSFWPRDQTWNSCIGRWIFTTESPGKTPLGRIVQLLSHIQLFAIQWTVAYQAPLSMGILQTRIVEWVAMLSSRGSSQLSKNYYLHGNSFRISFMF